MLSQPKSYRPAFGALCLLLLLIFAAALRLYRLSEQSVRFDEYNGVVVQEQPDYWAHMAHIRQENPDHQPVYFTIAYFWGHYAAERSVYGQRLLSVLFSLAVIPLLFAFTRKIANLPAAAFAALLFALSPMHIFEGQNLRSYALVTLLCAASIYVFYTAATSGKRAWWMASVLINTLLLWTHMVTGLLLLCQGLALLLERRYRNAFVWGAAHLPGLLPLALWLTVFTSSVVEWYHLPSPMEMFNDLFGDDTSSVRHYGANALRTWSWLPQLDYQAIVPLMLVVDLLLGATFAGACVLGARELGRAPEPARFARKLLLLIALLPPIILLGISFLWQPIIMPRYSIYSSLALYALAGIAIFASPAPRKWLAGTFFVLYAVLLSVHLPSDSRSNYYGVAAFLKDNVAPGDSVLSVGSASARILRFHLGDTDFRLEGTHAMQRALDRTVHKIAAQQPQQRATVYVVIKDSAIYSTEVDNFRSALLELGLSFSEDAFANFTIFGVRRGTFKEVPEQLPLVNDEPLDAYLPILQRSGFEGDTDERMRAARLLHMMLPSPRLARHVDGLAYAAMLVAQVDPPLSEHLARAALNEEGDWPAAHAALGVALYKMDRIEEAREAFAAAAEGEFLPAVRPVFAELAAGDDAAARREAEKVIENGSWMPTALRQILGMDLTA